jgi:sphinganine-1-phosphate aldolase
MNEMDRVLAELERLRVDDLPTHGGRTLAYVYDSGIAEADELGRRALAMYGSTNGLDPTAFPSLLRMEADLVATARRMFHASDDVVGSVTSGGTESILLAVKTARDAAAVERPVVVVPSTIHAAFHKACHYFGVERVSVPVDPVTFRADPDAMAAAMDEHSGRVVLVAASAPSYAHGVIDPIEDVAAHTRERGLRFHVDACIGGWVLPWAGGGTAGVPVPGRRTIEPWDFAVEGVTSLSADLHKYAYAPKGVSLLLHATPALRRPQFFASADWPGYTMLNATVQSTKSGGPLAAAWAVVRYFGDDGYARLVRTALEGTAAVVAGIAEVDHLSVVVPPDSTLVAIAADAACDVFTISDLMLERGWFVQPQMGFDGAPATLHLSLSAATAASVPQFLDALREAVTVAVERGPIQVDEGLRAAAEAIDPATLDDAAFAGLLQIAGLAGDGGSAGVPGDGRQSSTVEAPAQMAPVNALLDVAPPRLREALLVAFLDHLTR